MQTDQQPIRTLKDARSFLKRVLSPSSYQFATPSTDLAPKLSEPATGSTQDLKEMSEGGANGINLIINLKQPKKNRPAKKKKKRGFML